MDGFNISVDFELPEEFVHRHRKLDDILADEYTMMEINQLFAEKIDPWVPGNTGALSNSVQVDENGITYNSPYAHYQYMGEVYAPNLPITNSEGNITGWYSMPGVKKHPTGREMGLYGTWKGWTFGYNREYHPLATHHWDEYAWPVIKDEFEQEVQDLLIRKIREIYG